MNDKPELVFSDARGRHAITMTGSRLSLGRGPQQDVVLTEPFVSRQHAMILARSGSFEILDENSTHGTFVNGLRVSRAALRAGDLLQLGSLDAPALHFSWPHAGGSHSSVRLSGADDLLQSLTGFMPRAEERDPVQARELEQLNFLLTAARRLNAGTAMDDVLRALLQLSIQLTGVERGFVFLSQGSSMPLAQGLRADGEPLREDSTVSRRAIGNAIASDCSYSVSDTLSDFAAASESVVINNIRRIYCIPLRKRGAEEDSGRLLGLLYLDSQLRVDRLSAIDHQLLDAIATEAAALLHNALLAEAEAKARKAREELTVAAQIHAGLMSNTLPKLPFAELSARSIPCLAIGGDFYDAVVRPDCLRVTIADISGKGVSSAIVAATLQGIIHAGMLADGELPAIASTLNQFLCGRNVGKYATLILLKLYPDGRLEYVNCGHVQPLLVHPDRV